MGCDKERLVSELICVRHNFQQLIIIITQFYIQSFLKCHSQMHTNSSATMT